MKSVNLLCSAWGSTLLKNLNSLWQNKKMCDVKLVLQGGTVMSAHSCVMAAASPFFKSILEGVENPELNMEDFPKEIIEQVLAFVYTGAVDINQADLYMLYTVAVDLNIYLLQDMVKQVMQIVDKGEQCDGSEQLTEYFMDNTDSLADIHMTRVTDEKEPRHDDKNSSNDETKGMQQMSNHRRTQKYPAYVKGNGEDDFVMFSDTQNFGSCQKVIEIKLETAPNIRRHRGRPKKNKNVKQHGVVLKPSTISAPRKGVFTKTPFPKAVSFGPYSTCNEKKDSLKPRHHHNWMKLVQFAPTKEQQNLEAYKSSGYVFFRTTKDIDADVELLLWCPEGHQEMLGITEASKDDEDALALNSDTIFLPVGQVFEPPASRFDCDECGMAFISEVVFHKHMRQKHDKPLPLDIYLKIEKEKQAKMANKGDGLVVEQENSKPIILESIGVQRRQPKDSQNVKKPHMCSVCGKTFMKTITLKQHAVIHFKERPYKCKVCGKGFTQTGNLSTHMMIHTGEKPFKCDKCGKGFAEASNFRRHCRMHMGEKPYLCFTCGKRFSQFCHLKSHALKHSGERPFKCTVCSKGFCEKSSLAVHMKRHGEKIYLCSFCNKTFYTSCELITHKKANHLS